MPTSKALTTLANKVKTSSQISSALTSNNCFTPLQYDNSLIGLKDFTTWLLQTSNIPKPSTTSIDEYLDKQEVMPI